MITLLSVALAISLMSNLALGVIALWQHKIIQEAAAELGVPLR